MTTIGMRGNGRAALGALVIGLAAATASCATSAELASLKEEVAKLKAKLKAQDGERPSPEQQVLFLQKREDSLDKQLGGARADDGVERKVIQQALDAADKEIPPAGGERGGTIESFDCNAAICKCRTKHASEKTFEAFQRAAFTGVQGPVDAGDTPRLFRGWFTITEAGPKDGTFKTLFYLGKLPPQKAAPQPSVRPK